MVHIWLVHHHPKTWQRGIRLEPVPFSQGSLWDLLALELGPLLGSQGGLLQEPLLELVSELHHGLLVHTLPNAAEVEVEDLTTNSPFRQGPPCLNAYA